MKNSVTDLVKQHFSNVKLALTALELVLCTAHVGLCFPNKRLPSIFLQFNYTFTNTIKVVAEHCIAQQTQPNL